MFKHASNGACGLSWIEELLESRPYPITGPLYRSMATTRQRLTNGGRLRMPTPMHVSQKGKETGIRRSSKLPRSGPLNWVRRRVDLLNRDITFPAPQHVLVFFYLLIHPGVGGCLQRTPEPAQFNSLYVFSWSKLLLKFPPETSRRRLLVTKSQPQSQLKKKLT